MELFLQDVKYLMNLGKSKISLPTETLRYLIPLLLSLLLHDRSIAQPHTTTKILVQISPGEKTLGQIFQEIESQTGFSFSYNNHTVDIELKIALIEEIIALSDLLNKLGKKTGLKFIPINKNIVVTPKIEKAKEQKYTVSGYIKNIDSGEELFGATLYDRSRKTGTVSNFYGFFSLTMEEGPVSLQISYLGYEGKTLTFELDNDTDLTDILMVPNGTLAEVVIEAEQSESLVESTQMGKINMPVEQIKSLPFIAGEVDIIKAMQLLPGVQAGGEGASGMYVRGGSQDQNLYMLDGVPLYNINHLGGFFSVFDPSATSNTNLIKGGFPARYGGRLSSVVDIKMKEGNNQEYHGEGSIGLIASRFSFEGPIIRDKCSFIISARRTYIDLITRPIILLVNDGNFDWRYNFYDLNAKINYQFSQKDKIYLSVYGGDDRYGIKSKLNQNNHSKFLLAWGNIVSAIRWNHLFSDRIFTNITAHYSRYRMTTNLQSEYEITGNGSYSSQSSFEYLSGIQDLSANFSLDYFLPNNHILLGGSTALHQFVPGLKVNKNFLSSSTSNTFVQNTTLGSHNVQALEISAFWEDEITLSHKLHCNIGIRYSYFMPGRKSYQSFQPRLSARYLIIPGLSVKASYSEMQQNIHLLINNSGSFPTDLWMPVTNRIGPQYSKQWSFGIAKFFFEGKVEATLEVYDKRMSGLIEYKEGGSFFVDATDWQEKVETGGNGHSKGIEFFLHKKKGKLNGWIGYALSKTDRQFDNLNGGNPFPFRYDRRHNISIASNYQVKDHIKLSASWTYGSGYALTLPVAAYHRPRVNPGSYKGPLHSYGTKNAFRSPAYHRMDVSVSLEKQKKKFLRTWVFGVYNLYNHNNPYAIYIDDYSRGFMSKESSSKPTFIQQSFFPFFPFVSYQLKL